MVQHVEFRRKWDSLGPSVECPTGCLSEGYLLSISQDHNWAHLSIDLPEAGGWQTYHHTPSPSGLLCWRAWLQIIIAQELPWWREWSVLRTDLTSLQSHVHPQAITVLFQVVGLWSRVNHQTLSLPCPSLSSRLHEMKFWPSRERWSFSLPLQLGTLSCKFQPWIGMRIDCLYFACIRKSAF